MYLDHIGWTRRYHCFGLYWLPVRGRIWLLRDQWNRSTIYMVSQGSCNDPSFFCFPLLVSILKRYLRGAFYLWIMTILLWIFLWFLSSTRAENSLIICFCFFPNLHSSSSFSPALRIILVRYLSELLLMLYIWTWYENVNRCCMLNTNLPWYGS